MTNGHTTDSTDCNCRVKQSCLLNGRCLTESIVYRAEVRQAGNDIVKMYTGLTEGTFEQCYNNHLSTFRHQKYENSTGLSKYICKKKRDNEECDVKWSIVQRAKPCRGVPMLRELREKTTLVRAPTFFLLVQMTINNRPRAPSTWRRRGASQLAAKRMYVYVCAYA